MPDKSKKPIIGISTCMDVRTNGGAERTYQYLEISYADAVIEAGGAPIIIPFLKDVSLYGGIVEGIDGLLMPGGESLPSNVPGEVVEVELNLEPECRYAQDTALLDAALAQRKPILGICYGMQFFNIYLGGTLYYDIPHQLPDATTHKPGDPEFRHTIELSEGTRLKSILGCDELGVNSSHHQSIRDVADGLRLAAVCEDGVIEAVEGEGELFIVGVQWHPEKMPDGSRRRLFSAFIQACKR